MRILVAVLLLTAPVVGCVGSDDSVDPSSQGPADGSVPATPDRVQRYAANGTSLPVDPDEVGDAVYDVTGFQGAEPTMGITSSGALFMAAYDRVLKSTDEGENWTEAYNFQVEGAPVDPLINADPMLWVDPVTDIVYDVPMYPPLACSSVISSEDEGETWTERHAVCPPIQPFDRQTFATAPPGPQAPDMAGEEHPTVLYLCYNQLPSTECYMSYDGGLTWPVNRPVWNEATGPEGSEDCAGQNGHPTSAPDGTIVVPKSWFCDGLFVSVSEDSGLTWDVRTGPQVGGDTLSPEVAFTPDGTMYALWQGDDHRTYLARSSDKGQSWEGPWDINPDGVNSTVFAGLAAGSDGRIGAAFLGTEDTDEYPNDAPEDTRWHLYVVTSTDAGSDQPTFTSRQVTPDDDPVQVGCVWIGGGGSPCRNMLDFIDATIGPEGTFYVSYTEGCTEECADKQDATGEDSRDDAAAIARLDGFSLLEPGQSRSDVIATPAGSTPAAGLTTSR